MTKDESVEKTLREAGIFPPSVQDRHYGDKAEMTREEIIGKTLREMSLFSSSEQGSQSSYNAGHLSTVIAELRRRLPDGNIKTCGAFRHLDAGCCGSCHTSRPHYSMNLIELPDGSKAWVCCAMIRAIYPERYAETMKRYAERMKRFRNSPQMKRWRERFGGDGYLEN
jgi:hypothetical protein